jgi:hypothetical protein
MSVTSGMPMAIRPGEGEIGLYVDRLNSEGGTVFSVPQLGEDAVIFARDGQPINMGRPIMLMVAESTGGRRLGLATHRMRTLKRVLNNIWLAEEVASIRGAK